MKLARQGFDADGNSRGGSGSENSKDSGAVLAMVGLQHFRLRCCSFGSRAMDAKL